MYMLSLVSYFGTLLKFLSGKKSNFIFFFYVAYFSRNKKENIKFKASLKIGNHRKPLDMDIYSIL